YTEVAKSLGLKDVKYIPISALNGDNIVEKSDKLRWYEGESLLHHLENVEVAKDVNHTDARFPVQYVIRPQSDELHDYRGYAGKIISGVYRKGDKVTIQPSGLETTLKAIEIDGGKEVEEAYAPQSVVMHLEDDLDVSRGDMIVLNNNQPLVEQEFEVLLCWMGNKPLKPGNKYFMQVNSRVVRSVVRDIEYKLDVNTLQKIDAPEKAELNDIIKATIKTALPIPVDSYKDLRVNGGAILIDETSLVTVGACMIQ
ncbi:MAG: elongation factor 1-alpha C-terminal domain-related protein, partial [Segetibacter sp.]